MKHAMPPKTPPQGITRRQLLTKGTALGASFVIGASYVTANDAAWATEMNALKPDNFATLVQMARDIYPHDQVPTENYVAAVKGYDTPDEVDEIEAGIEALDEAARAQGHGRYVDIGWEADRVKVLEAIADSDFFQRVRGGLVTGLYNQKSVWPIFGYEGESFSQGGYLHRGFDDIAWI